VSAVDVLTAIGPTVFTLLDTFPLWGPVLALMAGVLIWHAVRLTWGDRAKDPEDTGGHLVPAVPPAVRTVEDTVEDTLTPGRVTCGDTVPPVSPAGETGGA
jgi:hypothetical protein